jgi:hypothetical protein
VSKQVNPQNNRVSAYFILRWFSSILKYFAYLYLATCNVETAIYPTKLTRWEKGKVIWGTRNQAISESNEIA